MKTLFLIFLFCIFYFSVLSQNSAALFSDFNPKGGSVSPDLHYAPLPDSAFVPDSSHRYIASDSSLRVRTFYGYDAMGRENHYLCYSTFNSQYDKEEKYYYYNNCGKVKLFKKFWDDDTVEIIKTRWYNNSFKSQETKWLVSGGVFDLYSMIKLTDSTNTLHPVYKTYWWDRINLNWVYSKTHEYFYNATTNLLDSIYHYSETSIYKNPGKSREDFSLRVFNYDGQQKLLSEYDYSMLTSNSEPFSWSLYYYNDSNLIEHIEDWGYTIWSYPEETSWKIYKYYDFGKVKEYIEGYLELGSGSANNYKFTYFYDTNKVLILRKYFHNTVKNRNRTWKYFTFTTYFNTLLYVRTNDIASDNNNFINLFPNPFTNNINYILFREYDKLLIFNIKGQLLKSIEIKNKQEEINLKDLLNGEYLFVFLNNTGYSFVQKVIKQSE